MTSVTDYETWADDPPCTCCGDSGWKFQAERWCDCDAGIRARESLACDGTCNHNHIALPGAEDVALAEAIVREARALPA